MMMVVPHGYHRDTGKEVYHALVQKGVSCLFVPLDVDGGCARRGRPDRGPCSADADGFSYGCRCTGGSTRGRLESNPVATGIQIGRSALTGPWADPRRGPVANAIPDKRTDSSSCPESGWCASRW